MAKYRDEGASTLLVAHDMNTIGTLCSRAVWLEHGEVKAVGPAKEVVSIYRQAQPVKK